MKPESMINMKNPTPANAGAAAAGLGVTPADVEKKPVVLSVSAEEFNELLRECEDVRYDYEEALDFLFKEVVRPLLEGLGYEIVKYEKFVHASTISAQAWVSPEFEEFCEEHPAEDEIYAYAKFKGADILLTFYFPFEEYVSALVWLKPKKEK